MPISKTTGDELPNFSGETLSGKIDIHDWIQDAQSHKDGEEVYTLLLTFPSLQNPVSVSEFGWLGKAETHVLLGQRWCRVLCVCSSVPYELKNFMADVPGSYVGGIACACCSCPTPTPPSPSPPLL